MIDLRSDVLGPYEEETLAVLLAAAKDRPGFVRHEDPHQARLERETAEAFGFEAALFVPTGTMANQIAIRVWCAPGEAIVTDPECHVAVNEASSTAGVNSVALRFVPGERGHLSPAAVKAALLPKASSTSERRIRLVWLENTHNRAGGTVMPVRWLPETAAICAAAGASIHVDGARIWHAAVSSGCALSEIARGASSLTVCLNKAIGAPIGALLMGSAGFVDEAARVQKMFGGLWRPVGMLAAAAHAAVSHQRSRIAISHERARALASRLASRLQGAASIPAPETNIVMVGLASEEHVRRVLRGLTARGVRASAYGRSRLRFVLHAGISSTDVVTAAEQVAGEVEDALTQLGGGEHAWTLATTS